VNRDEQVVRLYLLRFFNYRSAEGGAFGRFPFPTMKSPGLPFHSFFSIPGSGDVQRRRITTSYGSALSLRWGHPLTDSFTFFFVVVWDPPHKS